MKRVYNLPSVRLFARFVSSSKASLI